MGGDEFPERAYGFVAVGGREARDKKHRERAERSGGEEMSEKNHWSEALAMFAARFVDAARAHGVQTVPALRDVKRYVNEWRLRDFYSPEVIAELDRFLVVSSAGQMHTGSWFAMLAVRGRKRLREYGVHLSHFSDKGETEARIFRFIKRRKLGKELLEFLNEYQDLFRERRFATLKEAAKSMRARLREDRSETFPVWLNRKVRMLLRKKKREDLWAELPNI